MIIWTGWGVLVAVIAVVGMIVAGGLSDIFQTDKDWPFAIGAIVSAAINYFVAEKLEDKGRLVVDPESGEQILLKKSHSFFFIPMKYWTYAFAALALGIIFLS
jgi:hypothetical protein